MDFFYAVTAGAAATGSDKKYFESLALPVAACTPC
jgi:hypothetical protein